MKSNSFKLTETDKEDLNNIAEQIKKGAIAVIPTDTIYGIITSALNQASVEKVYKLRKRNSTKPMIILVESEKQILDLGIELSSKEIELLLSIWPNPVSVVIDAPIKKLNYLHRGKKTLAFRIPNNEWLTRFLKTAGPVVAPSANFEGEEPALTIRDARKYFKDSISFYIDDGEKKSKPSTVVRLQNDKLTVLREGAIKISPKLLS